MKKRVLFLVGNELCVAGVPNVIMKIVEQLHDFYTFDVLTFSNKVGELDAKFLSYGGQIFKQEISRYPQHPITCFFAYHTLYKKLKRMFRENHYDIIHGHSGYYDGICLLAAKHAGIPVRISHGHGTYLWIGRNFLVKYYLEVGKLLILKNATQKLACSDVAGNTLFLRNSYMNILNPVDVTLYANNVKIPHNGINILHIGYFSQIKNQLFSINLLNCLRQKGIDARLSLIGYPDEPNYLEKMHALIKQHHLEQYISFLPRDYDKRDAFARTDFCILPSESEGLPLVALESQAAGVPCLMSDRISKDSDVGAGFFFPHDDLEKWTEAIISGVNVDSTRFAPSLQTISTQAYAEKIKNVYEA